MSKSISTISLKIKFLTNFMEESVSFSKDLLYNSDKDYMSALRPLKTYPFICTNVLYPSDLFSGKDNIDILKIIFNDENLINYINNNIPHTNMDDNAIGVNIGDNNSHCLCPTCINTIIRQNVIITLKALFPVSFPTVNDVVDSLDLIRDNTIDNFFSGNTVSKLVSDKQFSYLKVDGNIYTFSRLIWLNDVLNHPHYNKIIKEYHIFYNWLLSKYLEKTLNSYDSKLIQFNDDIDDFLITMYNNIFIPLSGTNDPNSDR